MKRAALYARVSTSQQEEQGTITSQVTALRERIAEDGCHLDPAHEFTDDGVSGSHLARPALDRLRDIACEGAFDVLYVLSPDRLARRYAHQYVVLEELSRWGVEVVFLNQPRIGDSPEDRLLVQILGVLAEYERELIRDRLRRGKLYKARQGQVFAVAPAYGYHYVPVDQPGGGRWEINESEAIFVRRIFHWCAEEQLSIQAICRRLNGEEEGFERVPPRKAQRWLSTTVGTILRRHAYTGTAYYNRTRRDSSRTIGQPKERGRGLRTATCRVERDREEWIPVAVPQIIPFPLWEQAQVQLDVNKKFASRNNKQRAVGRMSGTCYNSCRCESEMRRTHGLSTGVPLCLDTSVPPQGAEGRDGRLAGRTDSRDLRRTRLGDRSAGSGDCPCPPVCQLSTVRRSSESDERSEEYHSPRTV